MKFKGKYIFAKGSVKDTFFFLFDFPWLSYAPLDVNREDSESVLLNMKKDNIFYHIPYCKNTAD